MSVRADIDDSVIAQLGCAFRAYKTATQSCANNTVETLVWASESYDLGSDFASNTFTAPYAGFYAFDLSVHFTDTIPDGSRMMIGIRVNGTDCKIHLQRIGSAGDLILNSTIASVKLAASDAVTAFVYQQSGVAQTVGSDSRFTWFSGRLVSL